MSHQRRQTVCTVAEERRNAEETRKRPFDSQEANEGLLNAGDWNTLEVEVSENSYKTTINGTLIIDNPNVTEMVNSTGALALQLHSGANNEVYFKDIEVYIPTRITGCGDPEFTEYDSLVNDHDSSACVTVSGVHHENLETGHHFSLNKSHLVVSGAVDPKTIRMYSVIGKSIDLIKKSTGNYGFTRNLVPGIYFIQLANHSPVIKIILTEY